MKLSRLVLLGLVCGLAFCGDEGKSSSPLVSHEYGKASSQFQNSLTEANRKLVELQAQQKRAIEAAKNQSVTDEQGIHSLKDYDLLISIRYVNESGQYEKAGELSQADRDNLNKLFDTYLRTKPFQNRVSAGHARRTIEWGVKRLEDLAKINSDPNENNNPDLEIISKQLKDAEQRVKTVQELAGKIGYKPESERGSDPYDRMPASE